MEISPYINYFKDPIFFFLFFKFLPFLNFFVALPHFVSHWEDEYLINCYLGGISFSRHPFTNVVIAWLHCLNTIEIHRNHRQKSQQQRKAVFILPCCLCLPLPKDGAQADKDVEACGSSIRAIPARKPWLIVGRERGAGGGGKVVGMQ